MIKFKVGDKVQIKERKGCAEDYPCYFANGMALQKGKIFTIREIVKFNPAYDNDKIKCKFYNGDDNYYLFEEFGCCWHSSMFEPIIKDYSYGDSIKVLEYSGTIEEATCFFVSFDAQGIEHKDVCLKIREKCSNFCEIAGNMGAVKHIDSQECFPEFPTIKQLVAFVNKINELYSQKPFGESKQILTTQKTKEHEIRFQKPKASYIRGNVPTGRTICGRGNKTAIKLGHLSNKACHF